VTKHVETELKLKLADAGQWREVANWPDFAGMADLSSWRCETLEAQYFDTPDYDLREARFAYRIRRENGQWVAAVKGGGSSEGGLHRRSEWEVRMDQPIPSIDNFRDTPVGEELASIIGDKPLIMLFTTRFERQTLELRPTEDTVIELALDRGAIIAGAEQEPIQEIELELKAGRLSVLLAVAARMADVFPLLFEDRSKYYRGLVLAGLTNVTAAFRGKYVDAEIGANDGARESLTGAIHAVLKAKERLLADSDNHEKLRQVRTKLRRLRALLAFFRPLVQEESYIQHQTALRDWNRFLGTVRETDVLLAAWAECSQRAMFSGGHRWLEEVLRDQRSAQMQNIRAQIAGGGATGMFLRLWAWLEGDAWQEEDATSFRDFCSRRLDDWMQKMLDYGKHPDFSDPDLLHEIRIEGKKLRYVIEAVDEFITPPAGELIVKLKKLQDALGYLRDAHLTGVSLAELLAERSSRALHKEAGILIGWQARGVIEGKGNEEKAWRKIRRQLARYRK
jgi:inorganic triphosphatase YgiF